MSVASLALNSPNGPKCLKVRRRFPLGPCVNTSINLSAVPHVRCGCGFWLVPVCVALLAGCAGDGPLRDSLPQRPIDVRAQISSLLPANTADRGGWAVDIHAALSALEIEPSVANICAVLAVTEQESGFRADPEVPGLAKIAWAEIDRRAERMGVPTVAVHLALKLPSSNGRSYAERIDAVRTESALSGIFEDLIDRVPLGKRLFANWNPVRTGGPMQVGIAFAERQVQERSYPYPVAESIRHEVFSRRGGMYFGIAHLLGFPAAYDAPIYRFADFNAGHYASRNAAFQNAVSIASGIPLDLDGDLVRPGDDAGKPGATELAVRSIARRLDASNAAIRDALEQGDRTSFENSGLYRHVFDLADRIEGKPVVRAMLPRIVLMSPKITRKLTTEWFARRVEERYRKCVSRAGTAPVGGGT